MSKINILCLLFILSFNAIASLSKGIQLIAKGQKEKGVLHLENHFENTTSEEQAKIALILSRIRDIKMENPSIYYAKYALRFLTKNLSQDEINLLNIELADYHLGIGNLTSSKKYYLTALNKTKDIKVQNYISYRLGWVEYNQENLKKAKAELLKSLKTDNKAMREDSLYLLGKITTELKSNLKQLQGKQILNQEAFVKGLNEGKEYVETKDIIGSYSKLYLSIKNKVKNTCSAIELKDLSLDGDLELTHTEIKSYLKTCLIKNKSLASYVQRLLNKSELKDSQEEVLALAYLMDENKEKSCKLYKELYKKDPSQYKGLILSCPLKELNLNEIAKLNLACEEYTLFGKVEPQILDEISKIKKLENKALVYASLNNNLSHQSFSKLVKTLNQCKSKKDLLARHVINDAKKLSNINLSAVYDDSCENNTQDMLKVAYLKYFNGDNSLKTKDLKCLDKNLDKESQESLLLSLDFNQNTKNNCLFTFDCTAKKLSNYVTNNKAITKEKAKRSLMTFYWRLNQLQKTSNLVQRKVTVNNLETLYSKVTTVKRLFIKPAFYNESLMLKASTDYNNLIETFIAKIESLSGLASDQKDLLKRALLKEKVVL